MAIQATDQQPDALFISLAQQLHTSFLHIARLNEAGNHTARIQTITEAAMQLTENYVLSMKLHAGATEPHVEPTSLHSVLRSVEYSLQPLASAYGVQLSMGDMGKLSPVMTDATILQAVLTSLGQVFIVSESQTEHPAPLELSAHLSKHGIVTGLYSSNSDLTRSALRRAHALQQKAAQPLRSFVSGPATGVFIADHLLDAVYARLHVARYHNMNGLAVTLPACQQMQLV